ncbi:HDIG domain protein [Desulfuromonas versatilis]|uniref:HDIG domain protein n=1 Tax=Desulfuromonas versatilis TaxID=2802975 RepID=A0ABM8HV58_9BACT|nr:HDOD domain-containing protein [Desulfuromonas versatilis]BCR04563.1 HDIG domain protein [Desulfuromonas versatilis]
MAETFQQIIRELSSLPLEPGTTARILIHLGNPTLSMRALASTIAADPVVAERLLQIARSPLYRISDKELGLEKALVRLGEERVRELVIDSFLDGLCPDATSAGRRLRDDALGCAMAAGIVNRICRTAKSEEAYLAGLLRHVGKMAMHRLDPGTCNRLEEVPGRSQTDDLDEEQRLFSFTHDQLGAALLEHWRFSSLVVQATRNHHGFSQVGDLNLTSCLDPQVYNLAATVSLAEGLCASLGIGVEKPRVDQDLAFQPGAIALSFGDREIDRALCQLQSQWAERT